MSGYPAPAEDYNLKTIPDMIERFGLVTGLSDQIFENYRDCKRGARCSIIEKHFTIDRNGGGSDDAFSLEPAEMENLCLDVKTAWSAMGRVDYGCKLSEKGNVQFRRSSYFIKEMKLGSCYNITYYTLHSSRVWFSA